MASEMHARATKLLVAAGGTGGHLYPALAVARSFQSLTGGADVIFVGTARGLEGRIVPQAGFPLEVVRAAPLRGGSLLRKLQGVLGLILGMVDAVRLLRKVRPTVVMGVGAYVSGTVMLAASLQGLPTLILEPNATPGLANSWLRRFVDEAAVAWEETKVFFGDKAVLTGNPVRASILAVPPLDVSTQSSNELRVLVFGGSQGSTVLNRTMVESLPHLEAEWGKLNITHQTGPGELEAMRSQYQRFPVRARVEPYLDSMEKEYAHCDVVVSRAGATTCAELAAAGRPSLLVPLPIAGGHQEHNAEMMVRAGAARMFRENVDLSPERLAAELKALGADPDRRIEMGRNARSLARPDAARAVAKRLVDLSGQPRLAEAKSDLREDDA